MLGSTLFLIIALFGLGPTVSTAQTGVKRVGVVDDKLLSHGDWVSQWASDWNADKIVALFEKQAIEAKVIDADVLVDPQKLKQFSAVMIPTDHCYPDEGLRVGPIARALREYVRGGGIYIMAMGASHSRWKDVATGTVSEDQGFQRDFLGLDWVLGGDHRKPGPALKLTDLGRAAGVPETSLPAASCARYVSPIGQVYVTNEAGQPCLYSSAVGEGAVIHYAGGLPLDAPVRDWLINAYAAILKKGIDDEALREATWESLAKARVYTMVPVSPRDSGHQIMLDGDWDLAEAKKATVDESGLEGLDWIKVKMSATIQYALWQAGKVPDPWFADNNKQLQWISGRDWYLRRRFRLPAGWAGRHGRLRFDGVDYIGSVWLDGQPLGTHEGMLGGPTFDISAGDPGQEHELLVRIEAGKGRSDTVMKPDLLCGQSMWGNKFWTIGLWAPVRLIGTGEAYMEAPLVRTTALGRSSADLGAQAMIFNSGPDAHGTVKARILDPRGKVVWQNETKQLVPHGGSFWETALRLANPRLWWPNGMGDHPLYRLELSLQIGGFEMDVIATRFGIRTLEVRRNPSFPDSPRRVAPMTSTSGAQAVSDWAWESSDESYRWLFVVNGRPFFAKGAAWLTSSDLLDLSPARERWTVEAARDCGVNLFRLNGGTTMFETDRFYDLCDECGILAWQELPLNWDETQTTDLAVWRDQITQSVLRIRQHPSLAIYVEGNEYNPAAPGLAAVLGVARQIITGNDDRPIRPSSPSMGRVSSPGGGTYHAYIIPEIWTGDPNGYLTVWGKGANFVSEWSIYAYANYSCLERILPREELARDPVGIDFEAFKASHPLMNGERYAEPWFSVYNFQKASWFGDLRKASLAQLIEYSQMGHAQTLGYVSEHWRADFPYKGGHSIWTWNIDAPCCSWSIVDWFGQPVIAYYTLKRANEPVHVMANTHWFSWGPGDRFHANVQAINDGVAPIPGAKMTAEILDRNLQPVASKSWDVEVPAGGIATAGHEIAWEIPNGTPESYFFLLTTLVDAHGKRLSQSMYYMRIVIALTDPAVRKAWQAKTSTDPLCPSGPWLKPQLAALPTTLAAKIVKSVVSGPDGLVTVSITNEGKRPAYPVVIRSTPDVYSAIWADNYFWLAPGETRVITGKIRLDMTGLDPMTNRKKARLSDVEIGVSAWNVAEILMRGAAE